MPCLAALVIVGAVVGSLGCAAAGIVRWTRRTGRRAWLWLLGSYIVANIVWAILRPLLAQP
jgi:hypothetical protein